MSTSDTQAQDGFYVSNVAPVPDKTIFTVVIDHPRVTGKIVQGYVIERPGQDREYLNSQGEEAPSPVFRDKLDAAVDSYKEWAAKH